MLPTTILIVEDETSLLTTIAYNLRREGYQVQTATDGEQALAAARQYRPDLILLDIMLPKVDGFEVCRQLRRESTVPIIVVTARSEEIDRVVGLEIGADDYLTKPFSMRELIARVKAMLRRRALLLQEVSAAAPDTERLRAGDLEIDVAAHRVTRAGAEVALKPKEFELLTFLVRNRGHIFSAEQLIERVWGYAYTGDTRTVAVHIRGLREKLEHDPSRPARIETIRGVGYRFVG
ncbi:MAG: response regulator transcription factor [Chloroflexi bacterium]|nr:response regulator transcription factor [Chloroflexota bacterium]